MSTFRWELLLGVLVLFAMLTGFLKLSNHPRGERYLQFWSPLLALIAGVVVLAFHGAIGVWIVKLLDAYAPGLTPYLLLVVNLVYLASFALIKASGIFGQRMIHMLWPDRSQERMKRSDRNTIMMFFEVHQETLRLKSEYRYASLIFRYSSMMSGLLLAAYFLLAIMPELQPYRSLLPDYLAVSFLLLVECSWFLAGGKGKLVKQAQRKSEARANVSFRDLFEEYRRLWPKQILTSGVINDPSDLEGHVETQQGEEMLAIVEALVQGRHLLVRDGMFRSSSRSIFPALYRLLFQNKKLLLIVESQQDLAQGASWFYEGIREAGGPAFAWTAAALSDAVEQNLAADLLLIKASDLLTDTLSDYMQHELEQHRSDIVVIVMEGEKLFSKYGNDLKLFAGRLRKGLDSTPQFVVFSDWAEALEDAMQKIFAVLPEDITIHQSRSRELYFMAIAQDRGMLQEGIMPRMAHRVLDPEASLVLPALKLGHQNIIIVDYDSMPGRDNMDELSENIVHAVKDYQLSNQTAGQVRTSVELHAREWTVAEHDDVLVINRDATRNLIQSIGRWWSAGKENAIVVVVSPPYLLRDYLADNKGFFLRNHRKIASIVPKPMANLKTNYLSMMDQLARTWLTSAELQANLRYAGIAESSLNDGVRKYAELLGQNSARRDMLEVRFRKRFDRAAGHYHKEILYRLNAEEVQRYKKTVLPSYEVRLQSGHTIAHLSGDVYQQYLPGQIAAFDSRWYRIVRIDDNSKCVELAAEPMTGSHLYKQSRTYTIRKDSLTLPNSNPVRWMIDRFELTFRSEFRGFDVHTNGYFDFQGSVNLQSERVVYVPLSEEDQGARRTYTQGNILSIMIQSKDAEFKQPDQLAFTLCYLLNELFVTLYPHNHHTLSVTTPLPDSFYSDNAGGNVSHERIRLYVPRLKPFSQKGNTKEILQLYVFEDSERNLGMIESVMDHWNHFIEILDDYLYWVFEESDTTGRDDYLCNGGSKPVSDLALRQLAVIMRRWLKEKSLRTLRLQYNKPEAEASPVRETGKITEIGTAHLRHQQAKQKVQDFFAAYNEAAAAAESASEPLIHRQDDLLAVFQDVQGVLLKELRGKLRRVDLVLVPHGKRLIDIGTSEGAVLRVTEPGRSRYGKAIRAEDGSVSIRLMENTARSDAVVAIAQELTYIWQADNLQMEVISPKELVDGHAIWAGIYVLEKLGYADAAETMRATWIDRKDANGEGFRALLKKLQDHRKADSVFAILIEAYGRVVL